MGIATRFRSLLRKPFLIRNGLADADKILTHTSPDEKDTLFRLAREKAGGVAVEIGSAFGASSCFIAAGIRPGGGKVYCVDKWNIEYRNEGGEAVNYCYREDGVLLTYKWNDAIQRADFVEVGRANGDCPTYAMFRSNTKAFADVIQEIRKDSVEAANEFHQQIDFLFVDGWHEYEGVRNDCLAWIPKIRSGGVVVLHDFAWADGVKRIVGEYVKPRTSAHRTLPNMFWASIL